MGNGIPPGSGKFPTFFCCLFFKPSLKTKTFLCFFLLMFAVMLSVGWKRERAGLWACLPLAGADLTLRVSLLSGLTAEVVVCNNM